MNYALTKHIYLCFRQFICIFKFNFHLKKLCKENIKTWLEVEVSSQLSLENI